MKTLQLVMQPSTAREDLEVLAQKDRRAMAQQLYPLASPSDIDAFLDGLDNACLFNESDIDAFLDGLDETMVAYGIGQIVAKKTG